jgi:hypothetical protein
MIPIMVMTMTIVMMRRMCPVLCAEVVRSVPAFALFPMLGHSTGSRT